MINFIEIINNMTLTEKLAQMTQLLGDYFASDDYTKLMGLSYGFETSEELEWNIGSILDLTGAEKLKRVQDEYLKRSRHKIPLMFMDLDINFEKTDAFMWLNANAQKYGFILRYPKDKTDITKMKYEPWHYRFVGVDNAKKINDSGVCLEEYVLSRFIEPQ